MFLELGQTDADADIQGYVADPTPPVLTALKKQRVAHVLELSNARGKKGAFGANIHTKMVDKMMGTGPGETLTRDEALGVTVQIKN